MEAERANKLFNRLEYGGAALMMLGSVGAYQLIDTVSDNKISAAESTVANFEACHTSESHELVLDEKGAIVAVESTVAIDPVEQAQDGIYVICDEEKFAEDVAEVPKPERLPETFKFTADPQYVEAILGDPNQFMGNGVINSDGERNATIGLFVGLNALCIGMIVLSRMSRRRRYAEAA